MALDPATLGYVLPADQDWISDGDDAISENARVTAGLFDKRSYERGRIPNGSDVLTLASGSWTVSSAGFADTMTNLPEKWPGRFIMDNGDEPIVKAATFKPYDRDYHWETVRAIGGTWMPWRKVGKGAQPDYAPNSIRQAQMVHHYGRVDTGGRGAVAWRIDHGLANFKAKMLPIFRAAGIVPMITLNSRSWDHAENAGVTPAEVNQWVADGWVEISNHGATHSNVTGDAAIEAYVAEGLTELEQQLPAAKGRVFGFHIAGVGVTGAFGGFQGGDTPARWDTVMGRAILRNHAFGSGYVPSTNLRVLDGQIRQGLYHTGTDTAAVSTITGLIDEAIATGRGLQIMSHPSNLDTTGYHTTAMIQAIVNHIVAKRTAGTLAVLSPYQLMVADSTRPPASAPAWSEVTNKPSTFTPAPHSHAVADVTGLAARLAPLEQDTGDRNITALVPGASGAGHWTMRRVGRWVYTNLYDLNLAATSQDYWQVAGFLPVGFRPPAASQYVHFQCAQRSTSGFTPGPFRVDRYGGATIYGVTGKQVAVTAMWLTNDPFPTTLPGTPA